MKDNAQLPRPRMKEHNSVTCPQENRITVLEQENKTQDKQLTDIKEILDRVENLVEHMYKIFDISWKVIKILIIPIILILLDQLIKTITFIPK